MPDDKKVSPEEILASLKQMMKKPVPDEELLKDIDKYQNKYLMDAESTKIAIMRDHGCPDEDYIPPVAEGRKISELHEGDICSVSGVVTEFAGRRKTTKKELMEFTISDDTGSIGVTVWEPKDDVIEGEPYTITNAKVKCYKGTVFLETNSNRITAYTGPTITPSVKVVAPVTEYGELVIGTKMMIKATVSRVYQRSDNPKAPRQKGTLDMNGGSVPFAHWGEYDLEEGCTYVFRNVIVKKGFKEPIDVNLPDKISFTKVN